MAANPDSDLYADAEAPATPPEETQEAPEGEDSMEESEESEGEVSEALLPRSLAGDLEPGDELVLQVVAVQDDSVRVKRAASRTSEPEAPEAPMMRGEMPDEMGAMME